MVEHFEDTESGHDYDNTITDIDQSIRAYNETQDDITEVTNGISNIFQPHEQDSISVLSTLTTDTSDQLSTSELPRTSEVPCAPIPSTSQWQAEPIDDIFPSLGIESALFSGTSTRTHAVEDSNSSKDLWEEEEQWNKNIPLTVERAAIVSEKPESSQSMRITRYKDKEEDPEEETEKPKRRRRYPGEIKLKVKKEASAKPPTQNVWQFLLQTIVNPEYNPRLVRWEDRRSGTFRIADGDGIALLWTQSRGLTKTIKYESFARGMRYYYAKGYITRRSNAKFVYQFGEPTKWRKFLKEHTLKSAAATPSHTQSTPPSPSSSNSS